MYSSFYGLTLIGSLLLYSACGGDDSNSEVGSNPSGAGGTTGKGGTGGGEGGQGNQGGQSGAGVGGVSGSAGTIAGSSGISGQAGGGNNAGNGGEGGNTQGGTTQGGNTQGGTTQGGTTQGGTTQGGSGGSAGCSPECKPPQVCSQSGSCIAPGTCLVDGDCGNGLVCNASTKICEPGSSCGVTKISAEQKEPNLLLVLDRSCSMKGYKWQTAVAALNKLTTAYKDKIHFGLILFPDTVKPNCEQDGGPIIPIKSGAEAQIQSLLTKALSNTDPYFPKNPCVTNIDTAMEQAATEPELFKKNRKSFVLLMTDGAQAGCSAAGGDKGTEKIIADLFSKKVGTFALGFSKGVDPKQMDKFAVLGGYPNPDPAHDFYLAEDEASLDAALATIAKQTLSCDYVLQSDPPDPDGIYVFFDKTDQIPRDKKHQEGWDYDPATKTVSFHGTACQDLKSGNVAKLDIVFGCANETIPPPPGCESGIGCDVEHLCPTDPKEGSGLCDAGCCLYGKFLSCSRFVGNQRTKFCDRSGNTSLCKILDHTLN